MIITVILKSQIDQTSLNNEWNNLLDTAIPGNIFDWDRIQMEIKKYFPINVYSKSVSGEKSETLNVGTIQYYQEITEKTYNVDSSVRELYVVQIDLYNPGSFGSKNYNLKDEDKTILRNFFNSTSYTLVSMEGIYTKQELINILENQGYISSSTSKNVTKVQVPVIKKVTDPNTGTETEVTEYETTTYNQPVKTATNMLSGFDFEKYGLYIVGGILALILLLKK